MSRASLRSTMLCYTSGTPNKTDGWENEMSKEQIIWLNGKINWVRIHKDEIILFLVFTVMLCLTGPIESL